MSSCSTSWRSSRELGLALAFAGHSQAIHPSSSCWWASAAWDGGIKDQIRQMTLLKTFFFKHSPLSQSRFASTCARHTLEYEGAERAITVLWLQCGRKRVKLNHHGLFEEVVGDMAPHSHSTEKQNQTPRVAQLCCWPFWYCLKEDKTNTFHLRLLLSYLKVHFLSPATSNTLSWTNIPTVVAMRLIRLRNSPKSQPVIYF